MVLYQSGHGIASDLVYGGAEIGGHLAQDIFVEHACRAYKTQRMIAIVVLGYIALKEFHKRTIYEIIYVLVVEVLVQEERILSQCAVGQCIGVHLVQQNVCCGLVFFVESSA